MTDKIKNWYKWGYWSAKMVKDAVENGVLTIEDYEQITGENYALG